MKDFILNFMKSKPQTTKVVSPKKTAKSKSDLPSLVYAPNGQEFWVNSGPVLRNLKELANYLEVIDVARYNFHTKNGSNDFANWVKHVLKDDKAAQAINKAKTISATLTAVNKSLKGYKI